MNNVGAFLLGEWTPPPAPPGGVSAEDIAAVVDALGPDYVAPDKPWNWDEDSARDLGNAIQAVNDSRLDALARIEAERFQNQVMMAAGVALVIGIAVALA